MQFYDIIYINDKNRGEQKKTKTTQVSSFFFVTVVLTMSIFSFCILDMQNCQTHIKVKFLEQKKIFLSIANERTNES